jgi:hypothetical protein
MRGLAELDQAGRGALALAPLLGAEAADELADLLLRLGRGDDRRRGQREEESEGSDRGTQGVPPRRRSYSETGLGVNFSLQDRAKSAFFVGPLG